MVLAGGGARGAYEAGVLAYICRELPPNLVKPGSIKVFCGTSVGSIHAAYMAGTAHIPGHDIERMLDVWRDMQLEQMLKITATDVMRLPLMFGDSLIGSLRLGDSFSILNASMRL